MGQKQPGATNKVVYKISSKTNIKNLENKKIYKQIEGGKDLSKENFFENEGSKNNCPCVNCKKYKKKLKKIIENEGKKGIRKYNRR